LSREALDQFLIEALAVADFDRRDEPCPVQPGDIIGNAVWALFGG
jgi:hypothetical protein